jgi:hypothetical protein
MGVECGLSLLLLLFLSVSAIAQAPVDVDSETAALLEQIKSPDASVRAEGVRELVGIREAVADELKRIVADANAGLDTSNDAAKLSAMYLMKVWRLAQCNATLDAEVNWRAPLVWPNGTAIQSFEGLHRRAKLGWTPGSGHTGFRWQTRVKEGRMAGDLYSAPVLRKALADIRSRDTGTFSEGEDGVYWWYEAVSESLAAALSLGDTHLYREDVKATLLFLAGEYRIHQREALLNNVGFLWDLPEIETYPSTLTVEGIDKRYAAIVAIVKCGPRFALDSMVYKLGDRTCPDGARQELAKALLLIDPEKGKAEFDKYYNYIRSDPPRRENDNPEVLARLDSVKTAFEQQ